MIKGIGVVVVAALLAGGCGLVTKPVGWAGAHPGRIECDGKASITVTGSFTDIGSIQADCEKFYFEQGAPTHTSLP